MRFSVTKGLGAFAALLIANVCTGSPSTDLTALLNSVHSMKATFTQTVMNNRGKAESKSHGRMAMQRPGKFRWDVTGPIPQLIIANDTKLWIYDPDLEQVTIRVLKKAAGETPALLLSDVGNSIDKDFVVKSVAGKPANWTWYELTPKNADDMFQSIKMGFLNKAIQEMRLSDSLGQTTVIQYQNISTNVNMPASLFTFKVNTKIDVIDETRKKR